MCEIDKESFKYLNFEFKTFSVSCMGYRIEYMRKVDIVQQDDAI